MRAGNHISDYISCFILIALLRMSFFLFQAKYFALQLGVQNDDLWISREGQKRRLESETAKVTGQTLQLRLLNDDLQKLQEEKSVLEKEKSDLVQAHALAEESRRQAYEQGYDAGYLKRQEELMAFLGNATPRRGASASRPGNSNPSQ
jgi:hypothetical protein